MESYRAAATEVVSEGTSPTLMPPQRNSSAGSADCSTARRRCGRAVASRGRAGDRHACFVAADRGVCSLPIGQAGKEGYLIRSTSVGGRRATVIAAASDIGVLYGAFAYLRLHADAAAARTARHRRRAEDRRSASSTIGTISMARSSAAMPAARCGTGRLCPAISDPRYTEYARANASIGINGTVPQQRQRQRRQPQRALYGEDRRAGGRIPALWRPRLSLAALHRAAGSRRSENLRSRRSGSASPGGAPRSEEIYRPIPDFGGFLVKANSEGQPGPRTMAAAMPTAPTCSPTCWRRMAAS